jgi:5,10-methylenetetrahydrofolate reductase
MTLSNGCSIPAECSLSRPVRRRETSFRVAGTRLRSSSFALIAEVHGIHLYTLNRYKDVASLVTDAGLRKAKSVSSAFRFFQT